MRHELLELYNLAIESCDADIIRAFQRARERIGPQIIIDVLLENAELREAAIQWAHLTGALDYSLDKGYTPAPLDENESGEVGRARQRLQRALASQPTPRASETGPGPCLTCGSAGFAASVLGPDRCEFCDGTFGGNPPDAARAGEEAERYRNLLLWALYHHQGSGSPVGQPIRKALGIGQYERLTANQIDAAARAGEVKS